MKKINSKTIPKNENIKGVGKKLFDADLAATDRFESMDGTYYKGEYRSEGISLYDLAVDVLKDAGVDSRTITPKSQASTSS